MVWRFFVQVCFPSVCMYLCQCDNCDLLIFPVLKHISNKGSWDLTWYVMYAQTRLHTIFSFQTLLAYTWSLTSTCNLSYNFQTSFYMGNFAHPCQILLDSKFLQLHGICRRFGLAKMLSKDDLASSVSTDIVTAVPSGTMLLHESDCCLFALCCGCSAHCGKCDFDVNGRLLALRITCVLSSFQTSRKSSNLTSGHVVSCFSLSGFHPSNMLFWNWWSWEDLEFLPDMQISWSTHLVFTLWMEDAYHMINQRMTSGSLLDDFAE